MRSFPFIEEEFLDGSRVRTFSSDVDVEELVWHRDDEDRSVRVIESKGWWFQRDGELPVELKAGDVLRIPRHEWHRVIRRSRSPLVVEITAF